MKHLKIAINGDGAGSGRRKWLTECGKIKLFFDVYTKASNTINLYPWNTMEEGTPIDWEHIVADVEEFELNQYLLPIEIIKRHGPHTMERYESFKSNILDANISAEEADVILTTIHAAKGLEWDNCLLLGDALCKLNEVLKHAPTRIQKNPHTQKKSHYKYTHPHLKMCTLSGSVGQSKMVV